MQLSPSADDAIRILLDLAMVEKRLTPQAISDMVQIPLSRVCELLGRLKRKDLVIFRQNENAVSLSRSPTEIYIRDVVRAVEEEIPVRLCGQCPKECFLGATGGRCPLDMVCAVIRLAAENALQELTLYQLMNRCPFQTI